MNETELCARLALAKVLAKEGGRRARELFRSGNFDVAFKGPGDPLTTADLAVDAFILDGIRRSFPQDGILSEESGGAEADVLWVIDPIDGTQNFSRGIARFAVSIAICENGQPIGGAIYDPMADELFFARRGGGAFLHDRAIRTSLICDPTCALIEAGYSAKHPWEAYHGLTGRLLSAGFGVRQVGSAALGLAEVACGRIDGYCEMHLESWDVAAAALIVAEAGGIVSNFFAGDLRMGGPIVAAARGLWEPLIAASAIADGRCAQTTLQC
ncbi:Inositol-1-monophosphatase [Hyphomicrobiales bacterium]|nr:Inositol-1-monophosphatase [Hyphomicrobiales bacterium]CAH1695394.1 Inositol-1-monophosphatase [Hyphomicrobiales bacterium]